MKVWYAWRRFFPTVICVLGVIGNLPIQLFRYEGVKEYEQGEEDQIR